MVTSAGNEVCSFDVSSFVPTTTTTTTTTSSAPNRNNNNAGESSNDASDAVIGTVSAFGGVGLLIGGVFVYVNFCGTSKAMGGNKKKNSNNENNDDDEMDGETNNNEDPAPTEVVSGNSSA